jgi:choline dehydrogenase-like flavoprotein
MRVAVIGSGPTGSACAKALVRYGLIPTMIDVGERLPPERQAAVDRMASVEPPSWSDADRALVTENVTLSQAGVPKKIVFGSDFHFGRDRLFSPTEAEEGLPVPTYARGGYTVAWGAAVLPTHDSDLEDWPLRGSDLEPSYRRVLAEFPLSAAPGAEFSSHFPLFKDDLKPLASSSDIDSFLSDLASVAKRDGAAPFLFEQARLAVDASRCRMCGLCLSGCVYGAIHTTEHDIDRLQAKGHLRYEGGWALECLEEDGTGVTLELRRAADREIRKERYDRVFVAAGAIQSTRIVLNSLGLFDTPVSMKDSQKFILPLLRARRSPLAWPNSVALAGAFLDFKVPGVSDHWVHAQVSSVNDYVLQRLRLAPHARSLKQRLLVPFYERLLIAWCGLHSEHSSSISLTLSSRRRDGLPILELRSEVNPRTPKLVRRIGRYLGKRLLRARTLAVLPALMLGPPGGGNHFGGTLPMRGRPSRPLETDLLGRPAGWRRIHVVDGAILPSIPATTLALVQMANADRIATTITEQSEAP